MYKSLIDYFGITNTNQSSEITIHCPFHDDKTPSLSVNTKDNIFFCHGCGERGSLKSLNLGVHIEAKSIIPTPPKKLSNSVLEYLKSRGFVSETIEHAHMVEKIINQGDGDKILLLRNLNNSITEKNILSKGVINQSNTPKSLFFANKNFKKNELIITEGWADVLTLKQFGYFNIIGLNGCSIDIDVVVSFISKLERNNIMTPATLYLALDNDTAGRDSTNKFIKEFINTHHYESQFIHILNYKDFIGSDVNSILQNNEIITRDAFIPFIDHCVNTWRQHIKGVFDPSIRANIFDKHIAFFLAKNNNKLKRDLIIDFQKQSVNFVSLFEDQTPEVIRNLNPLDNIESASEEIQPEYLTGFTYLDQNITLHDYKLIYICGNSGSGKTNLILNMMYNTENCMNPNIEQTLYSLEMPTTELAKRAYKITNKQLNKSNVSIVDFTVVEQRNSDKILNHLRKWLEDRKDKSKYQIIFLDHMQHITFGNMNDDLSKVQRYEGEFIKQISLIGRQYKVCFVILGQFTKSASQGKKSYRGSAEIEEAVDCMIQFERVNPLLKDKYTTQEEIISHERKYKYHRMLVIYKNRFGESTPEGQPSFVYNHNKGQLLKLNGVVMSEDNNLTDEY